MAIISSNQWGEAKAEINENAVPRKEASTMEAPLRVLSPTGDDDVTPKKYVDRYATYLYEITTPEDTASSVTKVVYEIPNWSKLKDSNGNIDYVFCIVSDENRNWETVEERIIKTDGTWTVYYWDNNYLQNQKYSVRITDEGKVQVKFEAGSSTARSVETKFLIKAFRGNTYNNNGFTPYIV